MRKKSHPVVYISDSDSPQNVSFKQTGPSLIPTESPSKPTRPSPFATPQKAKGVPWRDPKTGRLRFPKFPFQGKN